MIRVLIVDDHAVVRDGLTRLLQTAGDIDVAGVAADGAAALEVVDRGGVDVVLMDLSMPGMDGVTATRQIVESHPHVRVVVLTTFSDERRIFDALDAGASGYLLKDAGGDEVIAAIRSVTSGGAPLHPKAARVLLDAQRIRPPDLSPREREVLKLLAAGMANKQIARRLGIAERTVKAHLTRVFQQLGVTDRTQAALWAREHIE